jgi:hypothetical protein
MLLEREGIAHVLMSEGPRRISARSPSASAPDILEIQDSTEKRLSDIESAIHSSSLNYNTNTNGESPQL